MTDFSHKLKIDGMCSKNIISEFQEPNETDMCLLSARKYNDNEEQLLFGSEISEENESNNEGKSNADCRGENIGSLFKAEILEKLENNFEKKARLNCSDNNCVNISKTYKNGYLNTYGNNCNTLNHINTSKISTNATNSFSNNNNSKQTLSKGYSTEDLMNIAKKRQSVNANKCSVSNCEGFGRMMSLEDITRNNNIELNKELNKNILASNKFVRINKCVFSSGKARKSKRNKIAFGKVMLNTPKTYNFFSQNKPFGNKNYSAGIKKINNGSKFLWFNNKNKNINVSEGNTHKFCHDNLSNLEEKTYINFKDIKVDSLENGESESNKELLLKNSKIQLDDIEEDEDNIENNNFKYNAINDNFNDLNPYIPVEQRLFYSSEELEQEQEMYTNNNNDSGYINPVQIIKEIDKESNEIKTEIKLTNNP